MAQCGKAVASRFVICEFPCHFSVAGNPVTAYPQGSETTRLFVSWPVELVPLRAFPSPQQRSHRSNPPMTLENTPVFREVCPLAAVAAETPGNPAYPIWEASLPIWEPSVPTTIGVSFYLVPLKRFHPLFSATSWGVPFHLIPPCPKYSPFF